MKKLALIFLVLLFACGEEKPVEIEQTYSYYYPDSKPLIRWWWHASEYKKSDIKAQLDWLKDNNFGGVEIAWIYPVNRDPKHKKIDWLGKEWQELVVYTKNYATNIGLSCDFTFGTLWPFGGTFVPDSLRTKVMNNPDFKQKLRLSWEHPQVGNVIDHLDSSAFGNYANVMGTALMPALQGEKSALFCDSWEVETRNITTEGFKDRFIRTYGYDIGQYADSLYDEKNNQIFYDYMKLVSEYVTDNFYREFWRYAKNHNAFTRIQCAGSPTDLLTSYSYADVPETEAMLYEPNYANIVASSALLDGKKEVSSETFTCMYGFPDVHFGEEQTADMKLVADALFANGVNQIVWHGMPYNPVGSDSIRFYATVHTGPTANFADELKDFNEYLRKVSFLMKSGKPYTSIAVYLPTEDAWIAQELPQDKQMKWSWGEYEMRYVHFPEYTEGYQPTWINQSFINYGKVENNILKCGEGEFSALVVSADYLDLKTLKSIKEKADQGLKIYFEKRPKQAGRFKSRQFIDTLNLLYKMKNVSDQFDDVVDCKPIVSGKNVPEHRIRIIDDKYYIFFSHPLAKGLTLPLEYGFSKIDSAINKKVDITTNGVTQKVLLKFEPYSSVILVVDKNNNYSFLDLGFKPKPAVKEVLEK